MALHDKQPGTKPAGTRARKGKPLTENPLFPAVVALWFGALFGLGSLAIRVGLLEQLVLATKIDTVFPAAAPPLGVSARILLALILAAVGAMLGTWIARKIAAPKPVLRERKRGAAPAQVDSVIEFRARDSHPDAPARRPISAHEELGGGAPAGVHADAGAMVGRRRSALAIEHDESFELHETAPLPGGAWQIQQAEALPDDALDLGDFADGGSDGSLIGHFDPPPPAPSPALDWQAGSSSAADRQLFQPLPAAEPVTADPTAAPLDFTPPADALEGRQVFGMAQPQPDEVLDQLGITDAEFEDIAPVTLPSNAAQETALEVPAEFEPASADVAKLGMDALAAKLASSMQRRRERAAAKAAEVAVAAAAPNAAPEPSQPAEPSAYEAPAAEQSDSLELGATAAPEDSFLHPNDIPAPVLSDLPPPVAAPSMPQVFASPAEPEPVAAKGDEAVESVMSTRLPPALRPLVLDTDLDDNDDLSSLLPPRSISMPAPASSVAVATPEPVSAVPADDETNDEPADESRFSSLLNVAQPPAPRQDFVRIEEPSSDSLAIEPVVIFPGQAARMAAPAAPFTPPPATIDEAEEPSTFRRFDGPESAIAGQQITASAAPVQDAADTERALRAALANLQRMSGAA